MSNELNQYDPQGTAMRTPFDMGAFVLEWQNALQQRVEAQEISADTATGYKRGVMKFLAWLQSEQPTPNAIRAWQAVLLKAGVRPASVNAWLAGLRSFFSWLAEIGEIPFNPTHAIKGATRKDTKKRHNREALTDNEVRRLLKRPNRETAEGIRDYAMLTLMLYTAARGIELHRADLADLQTVNSKVVLYVQGKGHVEKDEMLVITSEAENAMRAWLSIRGKKAGALFISMSNRSKGERLSRRALRDIVKGYFDAAGVHGNKTTGSLRHTAITSAIRHGAAAEKVKGMSRHASLDTLMLYYRETDRIDDPAEQYISYGE
jgi:site-specific recombinase XerD